MAGIHEDSHGSNDVGVCCPQLAGHRAQHPVLWLSRAGGSIPSLFVTQPYLGLSLQFCHNVAAIATIVVAPHCCNPTGLVQHALLTNRYFTLHGGLIIYRAGSYQPGFAACMMHATGTPSECAAAVMAFPAPTTHLDGAGSLLLCCTAADRDIISATYQQSPAVAEPALEAALRLLAVEQPTTPLLEDDRSCQLRWAFVECIIASLLSPPMAAVEQQQQLPPSRLGLLLTCVKVLGTCLGEVAPGLLAYSAARLAGKALQLEQLPEIREGALQQDDAEVLSQGSDRSSGSSDRFTNNSSAPAAPLGGHSLLVIARILHLIGQALQQPAALAGATGATAAGETHDAAEGAGGLPFCRPMAVIIVSTLNFISIKLDADLAAAASAELSTITAAAVGVPGLSGLPAAVLQQLQDQAEALVTTLDADHASDTLADEDNTASSSSESSSSGSVRVIAELSRLLNQNAAGLSRLAKQLQEFGAALCTQLPQLAPQLCCANPDCTNCRRVSERDLVRAHLPFCKELPCMHFVCCMTRRGYQLLMRLQGPTHPVACNSGWKL